MNTKSHTQLGVYALVVLTAIYGLTAVMARYFSDEVSIFEQWYVRFAIAAVLLALVFRNKIRFRQLLRVSGREKFIFTARAIIGFVFAASLYAWASQHAKIGSVAAMQVVPTTALLGVLLLREKISPQKVLIIGLAFAGALVVVLQNPTDLLDVGLGEVASLVSGALFSLTFVMRKMQTGELNNYELSFVTTAIGAAANYLVVVCLDRQFLPSPQVFTPGLGALFIGAGMLSVAMSLLTHYGFEHVKATVASVILDLELLFGVLFGYLFYREILSAREFVGCSIILLAVFLIKKYDH